MIPSQEQLEAAIQSGWRVSPITLAQRLSPGFITAPHLRIVSDAFVEAVLHSGRVMISLPPGHGKSNLVSVLAVVWFLEHWPEKRVIVCGYGSDFAEKFGRLVRNLIIEHSDILSVRLRQDSKSASRWNTTAGGGMMTTGVGGPLTGHHADLLIIDDSIKNAEWANSWEIRESQWEWWSTTASTRLLPGAAVIVIGTRWNEDDLIGRLAKQGVEAWRILNFPAIYDEIAAAAGPDPLGRKLGEALWPERFPLEFLNTRQLTNPLQFESLYQQRPGTVAGKGNVYDSFSVGSHMRRCVFDPARPLVWALDFNRAPFCSVIAQYREYFEDGAYLTNQKSSRISVLSELCLSDVSTMEMCEAAAGRFREIVGNHPTEIEIYGDPAAGAKHTSQTRGTDYDIIRESFRNHRQFKVKLSISRKAPPIRERTNAVNMMLRNPLGEIRTLIDPSCRMLRRDLENVMWKRDLNGNITGQLDKSQSDLTHISDAFGYFVHRRFSLKSSESGYMPGLMQ